MFYQLILFSCFIRLSAHSFRMRHHSEVFRFFFSVCPLELMIRIIQIFLFHSIVCTFFQDEISFRGLSFFFLVRSSGVSVTDYLVRSEWQVKRKTWLVFKYRNPRVEMTRLDIFIVSMISRLNVPRELKMDRIQILFYFLIVQGMSEVVWMVYGILIYFTKDQ